jgi:4-amino-4-deoxy-L-arabinose transferase-like glycosyltransferase
MRGLALLLAIPVLVLLFVFPEVLEKLPNYARLLAILPAAISGTLWSLSSPGRYHRWQAIGGVIAAILLIVGAAAWYLISPDARA